MGRLREQRDIPSRSGAGPAQPAHPTPYGVRRLRQKELQRRQGRLRREVEALEHAIGEAEARRDEIDRELGDPEAWRSGRDMRGLADERDRLESDLAARLERWEAALTELDAVEADLAELRGTSAG